MKKLTILFFSRNDIDNAIDLVNDIKDVADEIVLVDQSDEKEKKKLMVFKRKSKLRKFKVYDCIALGYPEPLQAYAFTKCTNEWVLRLDTDERISEAIKMDLKRLIAQTQYDGFAIRRYENSGLDGKSSISTWQVRLFRKNKTEYTGILHEQPIIHGRLGKLDKRGYYISHAEALMRHEGLPFSRYGEIDRIDQRLSYSTYNKKIMEYVSKFLVVEPARAKETVTGRLISGWVNFYEKIFFRKPDSELSNFDYFIYYVIFESAFALQTKSIGKLADSLKMAYIRVKRMNEFKELPEGKTYFGISKIINTIGIIKFLELDRPIVMENLIKKYKGKPQGVALLIRLLKEKYLLNIENENKGSRISLV